LFSCSDDGLILKHEPPVVHARGARLWFTPGRGADLLLGDVRETLVKRDALSAARS
jgi:hypothetical protein